MNQNVKLQGAHDWRGQETIGLYLFELCLERADVRLPRILADLLVQQRDVPLGIKG